MDSLSLAYGLFCDTQQENLEYIYRGEFDVSVTDNILELAEESLRLARHKTVIKKRVYFVLVEGLQNITRHQEEKSVDTSIEQGLFVLQRRDNSYFVTTGNVIGKEDVAKLKEQLDILNQLDYKGLKEYSKFCLIDGSVSEKGGAGLGLIEIARKSSSLLSYSFKKLTDEYYYFYLLVEVKSNLSKLARSASEGDVSLMTIKSLHSILKEENITLNYSGIFNKSNMINLFNIVETQILNKVSVRETMYNIVVEMLHNLVRHADHYKLDNITGKYGIFFILEKDGNYVLTTGNYVKNEKIARLKRHIDFINSFDYSQSGDNFQHLKYNEENNIKVILSGIRDIKLRCKNELRYAFTAVDDKFSFFTFSVNIEPDKMD